MSQAPEEATGLWVQDLACGRGERALFEHFDLHARPGDIVRVLGDNGVGKTTLLRTLAGLLMPLAGRIGWQGEASRTARAEALCFIDHDNALSSALSPVENLVTMCRLNGRDRKLTSSHVRDVLATLGLKRVAQRPCRTLSAGQKRRVCLARLWLNSAPLWLLDEPAAALDVASRYVLAERIQAQAAAGGVVIYTTHEPLAISSQREIALV